MSIIVVVEFVSMWNTRSCKCFKYSLAEIYGNRDSYILFTFFNGVAWDNMLRRILFSPGYVEKIIDTNLLSDLACFFKNDFTLVNCLSIKDAYAWYSEPFYSDTIDVRWLLRELLLDYSEQLA